MSELPAEWRPWMLEAGIASGALCNGLTELRRANHVRHTSYSSAFFGISVGLERTMKMILVLDNRLSDEPVVPDLSKLSGRDLGHDLEKLYGATLSVVTPERAGEVWHPAPNTSILSTILGVLGPFAKTARYHYLDALVKGELPGAEDPIARWQEEVGERVISWKPLHWTQKRRLAQAEYMGEMLGDISFVRQTSELGTPISSMVHSFGQQVVSELVNQRAAFHIASCARYLAEILRALAWESRLSDVVSVPHLEEFFSPFLTSDDDLKRKRFTPPA